MFYNEHQWIKQLFDVHIMSQSDHMIVYCLPDKKIIIQLHSNNLLKSLYDIETNDLINKNPFWLFDGSDMTIPELNESIGILVCYVG